jgi:DNA repair exonuclease SbcCD ATPase subunit
LGGGTVENTILSLTDEIYAELVDGLKAGLDWTHFLAKHGASKGPLYNAISRFFSDMEARVRAFSEVQGKLDQVGLRLNQLDQEVNEADKVIQTKNHELALLEEKENTLKKQTVVLESNLEQKSTPLKRLQELGKLGFGEEKFKALCATLTEIGTKRGLKRDEAVNTFFVELKDYDAKTGFEQEIQRLETIIRTKTLEAEKWQAEAESLSRHHKDLSEAITAVQSLTKHGVKVEQVVSWNSIVSKFGGPDELQDKLEQYRSMSQLLAAKKSEIEDCDKNLIELSAQIKALNEQKAEIEGAIKSLSSSGVKEIAKVSDRTYAEQNARNITILDQFEALNAKAIEVGRQVGAVQEQIKKDTVARDLLILLQNPVSASYEEYSPLVLVLLKSISIWANMNKSKFSYYILLDKNLEEAVRHLGGS